MGAGLLAIALLFAALMNAPAALAQSSGARTPDANSAVGVGNDLRRIRCAGDAALCGWKRIPGVQLWRRGYRAHRRHRRD